VKEKNPVETAIDRYHSSMLDMTVARVAKEMAGRDLDEAKARYESAMDRLAATQDASDAAKVALRERLMQALAESIAPTQKDG
jgi:hypothetical protein